MDEDDWFYNSIKRYDKLQMFEFPKPVRELDVTFNNKICVVLGNSTYNLSEIVVLSLPETMHKKVEGGNVIQDRHMSFNNGYFTKSPLTQLNCVRNNNLVITSEEAGIFILRIMSDNDDSLNQIGSIESSITNAKIAVDVDKSYIALCNSTSNIKVIIDYETLREVCSISEADVPIYPATPHFLSTDTVSCLNTITGTINIFDLRSKKLIHGIQPPESTRSEFASQWTFCSSYEQGSCDPYAFYLYSKIGKLFVYDQRNLACCESFVCQKSDVSHSAKLRICPTDVRKIAMCGIDERVYVFEGAKTLFTHDGHPYNSDNYRQTLATNCAWLPQISSNSLISTGDDGSVQLWQYVVR